jgi:hypothetical protein
MALNFLSHWKLQLQRLPCEDVCFRSRHCCTEFCFGYRMLEVIMLLHLLIGDGTCMCNCNGIPLIFFIADLPLIWKEDILGHIRAGPAVHRTCRKQPCGVHSSDQQVCLCCKDFPDSSLNIISSFFIAYGLPVPICLSRPTVVPNVTCESALEVAELNWPYQMCG